MKKALFLAFLALPALIGAMSPEDEPLLKKYACPPGLQEKLDKAYQEDQKWALPGGPSVTQCPAGLACYVKYDISRIRMLDKYQWIIDYHGLGSTIVLPPKFLWHIPGRPDYPLDGSNYRVISEEMKKVTYTFVDPIRSATTQKLRDLAQFYAKSKYPDPHSDNIFPTRDQAGKEFWSDDFIHEVEESSPQRFTLIDTEDLQEKGLFKKFMCGMSKCYDIAQLANFDHATKKEHPIFRSAMKREIQRMEWAKIPGNPVDARERLFKNSHYLSKLAKKEKERAERDQVEKHYDRGCFLS